MTAQLHSKLAHLRQILRDYQSVLIAYSGGVDSALVVAIAHEQLREKSLACIAKSPSYPEREMRLALELLNQMKVPYRILETREHENPSYAANPNNRCYFCKSTLYTDLRQISQEEGWNAIADGVHSDDTTDHRHGLIAAAERDIRHPLMEANLNKQEVRELARELNLHVWDKPAAPCLSSRVPEGVAITPQLLKQIERAEDVLASAGFRQFRIRHQGDIARIEIPPEDFYRAIEMGDQLVRAIRSTGYRFVTLDLAGFRSGSLSQPQVIPITIDKHGAS